MTNNFPPGSAIELVSNGFLPKDWSYVPVDSNKATYIKGWATGHAMDSWQLVGERYRSNFHMRPDQIFKYPGATPYCGVGVVTGPPSNGLVMVDIDGHTADARFKEFLGDDYEEHGQESTMAWWSGTPGRRQIAYMLPKGMVPSLKEFTSLIFKEDGTWAQGQGDVGRTAEDREKPYQEVVVRFGNCMSVLPGSIHPSGRTYQWLNYNNGLPEIAPPWLLNLLEPYRNSRSGWDLFVDNYEDQQKLDTAGQLGNAGKYRECYEWWNKDEVQDKLIPRMKELIFNHPAFDEYGWTDRDGDKPHYTSGCPIHGGQSGTSFQINAENGLWHCKGCHARGNMFSFALKAHLNDWEAEPAEWRSKVYDVMKPIADALGYNLDNEIRDIKTQRVEIAEKERMSPDDWFQAIKKIVEEERNPGVKFKRLADLALSEGYRYTGTQVEAQYIEWAYAEATEKVNSDPFWFTKLKGMEYVIPHLLRTPSQTILHSAGGVGKSATAIALARAVGRGETMRVKGMEITIPRGKVLYINSDQSDEKLYQDLVDNGFTQEDFTWFILKRGWQMSQTMVLRDWIREHEPAMVIVDSIGSCSSRSTVSEIEKAFANPLYWVGEVNGSTSDEGFPSTAIVYIHHDNANGEARGNRYIINAIDEQWHLRKFKDDQERDRIRASGYNPLNTRVMEIRKSRQGREGDCFLVERDIDDRYAMHDWTPTVYNPPAAEGEDAPRADPRPADVVLDLVKQATEKQREESTKPKLGVTADEIYEQLCERMLGWASSEPPARKSVVRWLNRWVEKKLLHSEKRKISRGVVRFYVSRALPSRNGSLSSLFRNPNCRQGSEVRTENAPEGVALTPTQEMVAPDPETGGEDTSPEQESCPHPETQSTTENSPRVRSEDIQTEITREEADFWTPDEDDTEEPDMSGF